MQSGKYSQQFQMQIRSAFKFEFERHDFAPKVSLEGRDGEFCLVILDSEKCQIKFRLQKGAPEYFFGTLAAQLVWDDKPEWHTGDAIVAYLFARKPELAVPWPAEKKEWTTEETLRMFAKRLEPVASNIISAFAANLNVDWWKDYQADRVVRIQKNKSSVRPRPKSPPLESCSVPFFT
jgi:hypothetical protein